MPSFVLVNKIEIKAKIGSGNIFDIKISGFAGTISFHHDGTAFHALDNLFAIGIVNINDGAATFNQQLFK